MPRWPVPVKRQPMWMYQLPRRAVPTEHGFGGLFDLPRGELLRHRVICAHELCAWPLFFGKRSELLGLPNGPLRGLCRHYHLHKLRCRTVLGDNGGGSIDELHGLHDGPVRHRDRHDELHMVCCGTVPCDYRVGGLDELHGLRCR